jgi:hypothetical protein
VVEQLLELVALAVVVVTDLVMVAQGPLVKVSMVALGAAVLVVVEEERVVLAQIPLALTQVVMAVLA